MLAHSATGERRMGVTLVARSRALVERDSLLILLLIVLLILIDRGVITSTSRSRIREQERC